MRLIQCFLYLPTTAHSTDLCSALLTLNLVPQLIRLLPFSQGINSMVCNSKPYSEIICVIVARHDDDHRSLSFFCHSAQTLRVLANVAHKNPEFCVQLAQRGLLPALFATLKMADQEMVTLSLDVLSMLLVSGSQVN